ncbi:MAG: hypothetical protein Unbinned3138contig1000_34 [Prokaryotic dsDNA virus sp.]|nr:MAG: hypothetical protein Unbinned3138contig1000_34 [Prokaryotic dsDNA virus sp.]
MLAVGCCPAFTPFAAVRGFVTFPDASDESAELPPCTVVAAAEVSVISFMVALNRRAPSSVFGIVRDSNAIRG